MVDKIKKQNYVHLLILQNTHKKGSNTYKYKYDLLTLCITTKIYIVHECAFHVINKMYMYDEASMQLKCGKVRQSLVTLFVIYKNHSLFSFFEIPSNFEAKGRKDLK